MTELQIYCTREVERIINKGRNFINEILVFFGVLVVMFICPIIAKAYVPYTSYTYDSRGNPVHSPDAYIPVAVIDGNRMGVGNLEKPSDIFIKKEGSASGIYIVDTGNDRIIHCDNSWNVKRLITGFKKEGSIQNFNKPEGVFVAESGHIYISDTENKRIVELDISGRYIREITLTGEDTLIENYQFFPGRIAVDNGGRIYTLVRNTLDGIVSFDKKGKFVGFTGSNRVAVNPIDFFWKKISAREERDRMQLFVPTEFSSIDIDSEGFIYATTGMSRINVPPVRKQNPSGQDILRRLGYILPVGDVKYSNLYGNKGPSEFYDVCIHYDGIYSCLDNNRGRIFTYDSQGYLLFVTGGRTDVSQKGMFTNAVALDSSDEELFVLDNKSGSITVFSLTEYGGLIFAAEKLYSIGRYNEAALKWREVVKLNANFQYAYSGIGKTLSRNGEYKEAMKFFQLADDKEGYSKAYKKYREDKVRQNFGYIVFLLGLLYVANKLFNILKKRFSNRFDELRKRIDEGPVLGNIKHAFYTLVHPFKGFLEIKHGEKGKKAISVTIIILLIIVTLLKKRYTGFIFNNTNIKRLNLIKESLNLLTPLFLWMISYWSLQIFLGGEATGSNILNSTAQALVPLILMSLLTTIISNFLTMQEGAILQLINTIGILWTCILIFSSVYTINDYTVGKATLAIMTNVAGMLAISFLSIIFYNLMQDMFVFLYTILQEIRLR